MSNVKDTELKHNRYIKGITFRELTLCRKDDHCNTIKAKTRILTLSFFSQNIGILTSCSNEKTKKGGKNTINIEHHSIFRGVFMRKFIFEVIYIEKRN